MNATVSPRFSRWLRRFSRFPVFVFSSRKTGKEAPAFPDARDCGVYPDADGANPVARDGFAHMRGVIPKSEIRNPKSVHWALMLAQMVASLPAVFIAAETVYSKVKLSR